MIAIKGLNIIT